MTQSHVEFKTWKLYEDDVHAVFEITHGSGAKTTYYTYMSYEFARDKGLSGQDKIEEFLKKEIVKDSQRQEDTPFKTHFLTYTTSEVGTENFRKRFLDTKFNDPDTIRVLHRLAKK